MTAALILGVAVGLGVILVATGLLPARLSLAEALGRLDAAPQMRAGQSEVWWVRILGVPFVETSAGRLATRSARQDLRVIGRSPEEDVARHVLMLAVGLLWAPATFGLMALGGFRRFSSGR